MPAQMSPNAEMRLAVVFSALGLGPPPLKGRIVSAADRDDDGLTRTEELHSGLCAEDPEDERLWDGVVRIHERTGSVAGVEECCAPSARSTCGPFRIDVRHRVGWVNVIR